MRLDVLLFVAQTLKGWRAQSKYPPFKIRLNTNGLGNRINHKEIVPLLARVIDEVSISLNAPEESSWQKLVRPMEDSRLCPLRLSPLSLTRPRAAGAHTAARPAPLMHCERGTAPLTHGT